MRRIAWGNADVYRLLQCSAGLQALMARLLIAQIGSAVPVQGALLLQEHWCLASTLSRADTFALHQLAASALLPAVQSATQPSLNKRLTSTLGWGRTHPWPAPAVQRSFCLCQVCACTLLHYYIVAEHWGEAS